MTASGKTPGAYPLIDKTYDLNAEHLKKLGIEPSAEEWVVDVYYEDVGPYPPLLLFEELQRVGIAIELVDASVGVKVSPQRAVQLHPMAETMVRLGGTSLPVWSPIKIPTG